MTAHSIAHQQILRELSSIPAEYMPKLAEIIRNFRASFSSTKLEEASGQATGLSDEEIGELMNVEPLDGAGIVQAGLTGTWSSEGIVDSVAWVEEKRRERRARRSW